MPNIAIGRQPIFDRDLETVAYELLFRDADGKNQANIQDGDLATTQVIVNAITEIGMKKLVNNRQAFLNVTNTFLKGEIELPEMDKHFVLEILETVPVDEEAVLGARKLCKQGFTIALDDFIYHPKLEPFVELAGIIKLDILAQEKKEIEEAVKAFKKRGKKLLAEKVETYEQFEFCKSLNFDYYQGYFFCKPEVLTQKSMPMAKVQILKVLSKLHDPEIGIDELTDDISKDVTLSYRLLRYLNSAHFSLQQEVDSIRQAIMMLGWNTIRNIATLIIMSRIDDKPGDLLKTGLIRARMCSLLADRLAPKEVDTYFTAGLFSVIDAMMDTPIQDVIHRLPLAKDLQTALVYKQGEIGNVLGDVIKFVAGKLKPVTSTADYSMDDLNKTYLKAIQWADVAVAELSSA